MVGIGFIGDSKSDKFNQKFDFSIVNWEYSLLEEYGFQEIWRLFSNSWHQPNESQESGGKIKSDVRILRS
jgi:hypothetical protein